MITHALMNTRRGYSLLELVVSMAAATVLLAGLASSVFITLETFNEQTASVLGSEASEVQATLLRDLGRATSFSVRNGDTATFTVPDETGDGADETLTYAYDDAADTLSLTVNGATTTLLAGVTDSEFAYLERDMVGRVPDPTPFDTADWGTRWADMVVFEGYNDRGKEDSVTLEVSTPSGTAAGDLLVAAVTIRDDETISPPAGEGWNQVEHQIHPNANLALGVWWKIADADEPSHHIFSQADNKDMYGWIMRFTGHDSANPVHASSGMTTGESNAPHSPAVTTTEDDALVLRIGGFDDNDITAGDPGLAGHIAITMGESNNGGSACSGGAGYLSQAAAGNSGTSAFSLTDNKEFITITIAIAPQ